MRRRQTRSTLCPYTALFRSAGLVRLRPKVRRCPHPACARYRRPYRPEAEGALALPRHEFGLDVIALVGALRYRERSEEHTSELQSRQYLVCRLLLVIIIHIL